LEEGITIVLDNNEILSGVCGVNDQNLKVIAGCLGGRIYTRGNEISLSGVDESCRDRFKTVINNLIHAVKEGENPSAEYVEALTGIFSLEDELPQPEGTGESRTSSVEQRAVEQRPAGQRPAEQGAAEQQAAGQRTVEQRAGSLAALRDNLIQIPQGFAKVFPRSRNQALYIQGMRDNDISFCVGPAGTGKTYLAIAESLRLVLSKKMRKLVLTRPVVEAGESLGYLPGDLTQKINPYLRPLYDAMEALVPYETIRHLEDTRAIEIAPLAYMRGRSLNDCVVLLDEAQNTTKEQMKMFLTRIGRGARAVITGDVTQIDLPRRIDSGLLHALSILQRVEGIFITYLNTGDVVRNPLIKKIIEAYDAENK